MPYRSPLHEIEVTDRYGEPRTLRQTRPARGYQLARTEETPAQALAKEVGVLVGMRVKALRQERGWTLAELCIRAGLRTSTPKSRMWEIENGVRQAVSLGTVYSLAMALGVEAFVLLPSVEEVESIAAPTKVEQTVVAVR